MEDLPNFFGLMNISGMINLEEVRPIKITIKNKKVGEKIKNG